MRFQEAYDKYLLLNTVNLQVFRLAALRDNTLTIESLVLNRFEQLPKLGVSPYITHSCKFYSIVGYYGFILFLLDYTDEVPRAYQGVWRPKFERA